MPFNNTDATLFLTLMPLYQLIARCQGVLEGVWITLIVMFSYSGGSNEDLGATPSNLMFGNTCFAIATISVNLKMLFIQHRWHWVELIVLVGSTALMYVCGGITVTVVCLRAVTIAVSWCI